MTTLRKQSLAAADLREQLKRSLAVTGGDLAGALSGIAATVGAPFPAKEDEYHVEEEAVGGTQSWDDGWFETEGEDQ